MPTKKAFSASGALPVPVEFVERRIHRIRSQKIILDRDLAELYGVPTFRLNEAVKRNKARFPKDFLFQLTAKESQSLTSQSAISNPTRGGRRTLSFAFTEQGVAMLSSVLNSERAVLINIAIMRAFVKLRELIATHTNLAKKIEALERKYDGHDEEIQVIFTAIKRLLERPAKSKPSIGFRA